MYVLDARTGKTVYGPQRLRSATYSASPVLTVNSENLNFVERDADFELLVSRIRAMKSRREFFSLG